jgi:hypothetical protein
LGRLGLAVFVHRRRSGMQCRWKPRSSRDYVHKRWPLPTARKLWIDDAMCRCLSIHWPSG